MGLGFRPLAASGLCLIANTAPVAFGALGAPVIALAAVTGLDPFQLSGMIGRILPFFSLIIPFWLVWTFAGFRGTLEVWPAIFVSGACFAGPQFLVSNFHGPWLVDIIAAIVSLAALTLFLRLWHPRKLWLSADLRGHEPGATIAGEADPAEVVIGNPGGHGHHSRQAVGQNTDAGSPDSRAETVKAWLPWVILTVFVFLWGIPQMKGLLDALFGPKLAIPGLDQLVQKMPPIVPKPHAEAAIYNLNLLSATGSGILFAAIIGGLVMGFSPIALLRSYWHTLKLIRYSLLTIACMLALGYVTRYAGTDASLGLAFAHTGVLYPLFGTLLGWLGVALTGSDTASNVLFGGLQKITAGQLGLDLILMAAANSCGGVMGKMIDAQSIVVASTATRWYGHEADILRFVFVHSITLAVLVGVLVMTLAHT
jgi:lactate permease